MAGTSPAMTVAIDSVISRGLLTRSTGGLWEIVKRLSAIDDGGAGLRVLNLGGETVDTKSATGKLILTIFEGFVTFERECRPFLVVPDQKWLAEFNEQGIGFVTYKKSGQLYAFPNLAVQLRA
jgi:hypothetical protein